MKTLHGHLTGTPGKPPQTVPRTMEEAFGPHTSRDLDLMPDPSPSRLEEAVCWIVSALALGFLLLMWLPQ